MVRIQDTGYNPIVDFGISEASSRMWDVITKVIEALGLIAGGLWTLKKYFDDRASERSLAHQRAKSAEVEARKPFSSRQLELYFDAVEVASAIAAGSAVEQAQQLATFWRLYWGPLALVEDMKVAQAMIQFGHALDANASQGELKIYALELAHACRDSIAESWKVTLPELDTARFLRPIDKSTENLKSPSAPAALRSPPQTPPRA